MKPRAIGQSLGLNYQTVNSDMDYLEGTFLLRRLQPYHANGRERGGRPRNTISSGRFFP